MRPSWALACALLGACATLASDQAPELFRPELVSTGASEWNATFSDAGALVFARSPEADFEHAKILTLDARGGAARPIDFTDARYADTDPQLSADGRLLLFASNRPAEAGGAARRDLDLWLSRRAGGGWSAPEPLPVVNSGGQELGPELHGRALYFNSARRGGVGGLDIYRAESAGGGFAPAAALPQPLNSAASEGDFTISPDGRLALFWSDRPGGFGEGDIYVARAEGAGWSAPLNLGAPVNSAAFDFTPSFSRDGRWLYFASMRPRQAGGGKSDIYRIRVEAVPALRQGVRR